MVSLIDKVRRLESLVRPSRPGYVIFFVTNRCNFRCNFCFYFDEIEKGQKADELSLDEIRRIAPGIGPLMQLSLTGGEPFLRKDFTEVTKVLLDHTHPVRVTIPTNGSLTSKTVAFLEEILPLYPDTFFRISFSIEGIGEEHDKLRSMPGSYKKVQESYAAISPFRERFDNFSLECNSVFSADSETTLINTIEHLSNEFSFDNMSVTYARGKIKDPELQKVTQERYREVNAFLESLEKKKKKGIVFPVVRGVSDVAHDILMRTEFDDEFVTPCLAGKKLLVISETGEVRPCEILSQTMGNLRDYGYDLGTLLGEPKQNELLNWIKDTKCKCTFECAIAANVAWHPTMYPKVLAASLRNIGKS
jgi:MoaA/NifB/PqqE/SkfB family radical SAM enzyme